MLERYRFRNGKNLRCGYTTGSCAAGASKGAAAILLTGKELSQVTLTLPGGEELLLELLDCSVEKEEVRCAVKKDAGDDKDVTNGILIYATVKKWKEKEIRIEGGQGIGRVTKKGLDQPVGEAAINSVPRRMIQNAVKEVCKEVGYTGGLWITIEAPKGEELAQKTFNPRLGIIGGISILGTSGIVEPMSEQALLDTIRVEMNMKRAKGSKNLLLTPGNYGLDFVEKNTALSCEYAVKCGNFIGDTLDMAVEMGFEQVLLIGHIGKLVKLGSGIMNTHSQYADGRMETLAVCGIEAGIHLTLLRQILECNTTEEALECLKKAGCLTAIIDRLVKRIEEHLLLRVKGAIQVAAVLFSNQYGLIGKTSLAEELLKTKQEIW